jgi:hypothetical protein
MDWTAIPWTKVVPFGAAVLSAIAAAVSAVFSWRSSQRAADTAATALILKFRDQYATNEMVVDLRNLRAWHDKYDSQFAETWRQRLQQDDPDPEALIVDRSRRRVTSFFSNIAYLHSADLVPKGAKKLLIDFAGLDVFFNEVELLERALSSDYDKAPFESLRNLRPSRAGRVQFTPINWVIRDP